MPLSDVAEEIFRNESEGGVKVALTLKAKTVVEDAFAQGEDVAVDMVEDASALDSPGPSAPAPAPAPHPRTTHVKEALLSFTARS
ncbi:hypothetical protein SKAU_G00010770 [Synaphobranchus kaupii]|uniref:Uncharacterized protein n=1 Tax=Synaphobranchus kaupii TaxID=118154 RepID=A0A9Q1G9Z1_SYNKA|nr:hypothetical protein SKAU_G00010770 [Synaphobranchus kaupii]